jgi:hypothetical protein
MTATSRPRAREPANSEAVLIWHRQGESERSRIVEPGRRRKAARLIREFVAGEITNDELDDQWPLGPGDPALNGVFEFVWVHYDDLSTHRFRGNEVSAANLLRCAKFLETDLPYVWKRPHWAIRGIANLLALITLGLANRLWDPSPNYWPFPSAN